MPDTDSPDTIRGQQGQKAPSILAGPAINPAFNKALDELVAVARQGHRPASPYFNPSIEWLTQRMRVLQDLPKAAQDKLLAEHQQLVAEGKKENEAGRAARRAGPDAVYRLDSGGLGFYSQLGVARRPDLTQYFVDGFGRNRDALAFNEANQALFADVIPYITKKLTEHIASGDTVVQTDRGIGDVPGRSFHARQLLFSDHYLQLPFMWRQLTFDLPAAERTRPPHILEVSLPTWLDDLGLPEELKGRVKQSGLTQLVFKAPTKGLSLHLGFDYAGEHKMGPLSIAMFLVKQAGGLAVQAALSTARAKTLEGTMTNTALVTIGPSLHGKSTLTIMLELADSQLAKTLRLEKDPKEGVYPMNDDIVLLQKLAHPAQVTRNGKSTTIAYGIDGTEDNFYAVPFGLTRQDDAITFEVIRGTPGASNKSETLENVPVDPKTGAPDYMQNPTRNMRMILNRKRLVERKAANHIIESVTGNKTKDSVHVPMEDIDQIFWQAVMRQNTVVPPLRRLSAAGYVRVLMYGEAVQMGAAAGAIGRPYVEYFSDPFIIGLEDENANLFLGVLKELERGGMTQRFYVFNTGGLGADTNDQASGAKYKKISRELTLMLQEALLRDAVKFERDPILRSDVAVAIVDKTDKEIVDLRREWLPKNIYGEAEYRQRVDDLVRRRYYGKDAQDKAGILRYTKVRDDVIDLEDVPAPKTERELAWLLSFYWHVDQAYPTLADLATHTTEGKKPAKPTLEGLQKVFTTGTKQGLDIGSDKKPTLTALGL